VRLLCAQRICRFLLRSWRPMRPTGSCFLGRWSCRTTHLSDAAQVPEVDVTCARNQAATSARCKPAIRRVRLHRRHPAAVRKNEKRGLTPGTPAFCYRRLSTSPKADMLVWKTRYSAKRTDFPARGSVSHRDRRTWDAGWSRATTPLLSSCRQTMVDYPSVTDGLVSRPGFIKGGWLWMD